jgi:capsular polysaccharide biosynthesis protein
MTLGQLRRGLYRRINHALPIRWTTTQDLAQARPGCWKELIPARQADWPPEIHSGPLPYQLSRYMPGELESKGILRLEDAWVSTPDGWVFTPEGDRVLNLSGFHRLHQIAPRVRLPFPRLHARRLRGTTLSLLSTWTTQNFYHFSLDSISRLHLLRRAGISWGEIDQVLLPVFDTPSGRRWVEAAGIPAAKIIPVRYGERFLVKADHLLCGSFPGMRRTCSAESVSFLQGLRYFTPTARPRRLFVYRRSHSRHMLNEAEVWACLAPLGFERIEPGQVDNPEQVFSEAEAVVGVHGAALTNLLFCNPGTRVLELLPSDHSYPCYVSMAHHAGLRYDALICPSTTVTERPIEEAYNSNFDFNVELPEFRNRLEVLGLHQRRPA